jgi:cbb3-type cytochrome oxidase maturation protein
MSVLYVIVPLALLGAGGAVLAFAWTVRSGQLDDLDTPARRILFDDDRPWHDRCDSGGHELLEHPSRRRV